MGVPITFLDKYNPDQFEILGLCGKHGLGLESYKRYNDYIEIRHDGVPTGSSGKKTNGNAVCKGKNPKRNRNFYLRKRDNDIVHSKSTRILIKNKSPKK